MDIMEKLAKIADVHKNSLRNNLVFVGDSDKKKAAALVKWRNRIQETIDALTVKVGKLNDAVLFLLGTVDDE